MEKTNNVIKLDITWMSIFRVIIVVLGLIFIYLIRDIVALIFVVFIIVAALNPYVARLEKILPRSLAVIIVYLLILAVLSIVSVIVFGPLAGQINQLANILPATIEKYTPAFESWRNSQGDVANILEQWLETFSGKLSNLTGNIFKTIFSLFGGVITAATILVLSFYLLLEEKAARQILVSVIPSNQRDRAHALIKKCSDKMGDWVRGQLILMLIIGILDFIVLSVFRIEGALALATWGGLTELIPYIGPIIGAVPAIIVAWTSGGIWLALVIAGIMVFLIQWLEGQIIVPNVMKRAVGLSPVIIIIALLIGGKLLHLIGIIIAIPIAALISVIVQEWDNIVKIYNNRN